MSGQSSKKRTTASAPADAEQINDISRIPATLRKAKIIEAIRESGFISVAEASTKLAVSEMTVRRDLVELEKEGLLARTHGGALLHEPDRLDAMDRDEPAFDARLRRFRQVKERIANAAAELVQPRQTVGLDVGTTTYLLAHRIAEMQNIRIFTNSLRIASVAASRRCDVYVPAGSVRADELSIWGPAAASHFENFWFDISFIGVSGMTSDGFYDYSMEDVDMKRVYVARSTKKIVLCDSSKFHRMSLVQVAPFEAIDMLITDAAPPADIAENLTLHGVEVLVV